MFTIRTLRLCNHSSTYDHRSGLRSKSKSKTVCVCVRTSCRYGFTPPRSREGCVGFGDGEWAAEEKKKCSQVDQRSRALTFDAVALSEPTEGLLDVQPPLPHLLFVGERREEQRNRGTVYRVQRRVRVRHVRRRRRERAERLRVRKQLWVGYRRCNGGHVTTCTYVLA